jgi:hypothetical protein
MVDLGHLTQFPHIVASRPQAVIKVEKKPLRRVAGRCSFKFYFFVNSKQDATFGLAETWV